jgi:hypothetical protein
MNFNFWQKWLLIAGIFVSVFGVAMVLNLTAEGFDAQFNPVFWGEEIPDIQVKNYQQWIIGVLGSVMVSWGIFIGFIAAVPFKKKEKWSRDCLLIAILSWYVLDTFISLNANVGFNALLNTAFAIVLIIPVGFTFNQFKNSKEKV